MEDLSAYGLLINSPPPNQCSKPVLFSHPHNMPAYSRAKRQSTGQSGLEYVINHVFCPLKLPQGNDHSLENDLVLLQAVVDVALAFNDQLPPYEQLLWMSIMKMLRNLKDSIRFSTLSAKEIEFQISTMHNWNRGSYHSIMVTCFPC
jgi:hypothetical protein